MAHTGSNKTTFAICYGFMEGRLHGHGLKKSLIKLGYSESSFKQADIIIAHSAGCWLIPKDAKPKLVVYVGMPLVMARPTHQWVRVTSTSLTKGNFLKNLLTRFKNTYHGIFGVRRNLQIMRHPRFGKPQFFPHAQVVFIANRYDEWPRGEVAEKFLNEKIWAFMSLPGTHEDIWEDSKKYAEIIKLYAERLLA